MGTRARSIPVLITRWASSKLIVPLVTRIAIGAVAMTAALLLNASVPGISQTRTPSQSLLVSQAVYLLTVPAGLVIGQLVLRFVPRYLRTLTSMPQLVSGADRIVVGSAGTVVTIIVGSSILGLRPTLSVAGSFSPLVVASIMFVAGLAGAISVMIERRVPASTAPTGEVIRIAVARRYLIPDLGWIFDRYVAVLTPTLNRFGLTIDPLRAPEIERVRERIASLASQLKPRVVVFLDDLDRLEKAELLLVLKLVKLSGCFPNLTYVLSMHRSRVEATIGSDGHDYLPKFVDIDVPVPMPSQDDLNSFILAQVRRICEQWPELHLTGLDSLEQAYRQAARTYLRTLREAKKTLNAFSVALGQISGEVNVVDLLFLEMVRRESVTAWTFIGEHPQLFLKGPWPSFVREEDWDRTRRDQYDQLWRLIPEERREVTQSLVKFVLSKYIANKAEAAKPPSPDATPAPEQGCECDPGV